MLFRSIVLPQLDAYSRQLQARRRNAASLTERLDGIPGLGEVRAKRLVKEMGGVNAVKKADRVAFDALSWLPSTVADAVHERFHPASTDGEGDRP